MANRVLEFLKRRPTVTQTVPTTEDITAPGVTTSFPPQVSPSQTKQLLTTKQVTAQGAPRWASAIADFLTALGPGGSQAAARQQETRRTALLQSAQQAAEQAQAPLQAQLLRQQMETTAIQNAIKKAPDYKPDGQGGLWKVSTDGTLEHIRPPATPEEGATLANSILSDIQTPEIRKSTAVAVSAHLSKNDMVGAANAATAGITRDLAQRNLADGQLAARADARYQDLATRVANGETLTTGEKAEMKGYKERKLLVPAFNVSVRPPPSEPGNYQPVQVKGETIGWVDPKSGNYKSVKDIKGLPEAVGGNVIPAKPTMATMNMAQLAQTILPHVPDLLSETDALSAELGPVAGRWNAMMSGGIGADNPRYITYRSDVGMFQTAVMLAHARGRMSNVIFNHFVKMFDAGMQSPGNMKAAINAAAKWLQGYAAEAGNPNAPSGSNRPANVPTDYIYKVNGPKGSGWYRP